MFQKNYITIAMIIALSIALLQLKLEVLSFSYKICLFSQTANDLYVSDVKSATELAQETTKNQSFYTERSPLASIGQVKDRKLSLGFTCNVCQSRNTKFISKQAYEKGVVIVKCGGCSNNHLIADNLGWWPDFTEKGLKNIEDILAARGESVRRVADPSDRVEISDQLELIPNVKYQK